MLDLLVIQPTPFCNIDCSYCYLPERSNTKKISLEVLEKTIERVRRDALISDTLSIVWHAGEPLTVNVEYFSEMLSLVKSRLPEIRVIHSIQTNGMLINQKWCDLINEFDIRIGVSLDGPQSINDAHRITRKKQGTFDKTMKGIALLKENGILYHAIAVVTNNSLDYPDEIFTFFKSNGFYQLGLNVEEIEGLNKDSSLTQMATEKILLFFKRMFELYVASDRQMGIREFDNSFAAITRNPEIPDITRHKFRTHQTAPLGIISVDYQGNFSTFSPELLGQQHARYGDFNLGNVKSDSFVQALKSEKFRTISGDITKGIRKCEKSCGYFHLCGGGAPANKLYENGTFDSTETMYCRNSIKIPLDITLTYLEGIVADQLNR